MFNESDLGTQEFRTRGWCFTWNNYSEKDIVTCRGLKSVYTVFGKEIAPTTGTPHLQGYFYFKEATTRSALCKKIKGASVRAAKGNAEQNQRYCSKEGEVYECGVPPHQGERKDLESIKKIIDDGGRLLDCFEGDFGTTCKYYKAFEKYISLKQKKRNKDDPHEVHWRWGVAGCGKSEFAYNNYKDVYNKPLGWFDQYANEECLLIDDFDDRTMESKDFLKLLDRYPYMGKTKGSFVHITSRVIVITSDHPPSYFWKQGNDLDQVIRRMTTVEEIPQKCLGNKEPNTV